MSFQLLTPKGSSHEMTCDSVSLTLEDNAEGRGGGSIGILYGHAPAVMALGKGPAVVKELGNIVFSAQVNGGFASVRDNRITVITDEAVIDENKPEDNKYLE